MARRPAHAGGGAIAVATCTAAVLGEPRTFGPREVPLPAGEVLIEVEGCGVCASSLPVWEGRPWFAYPLEPGAPGHEVWGRTEDGRRVTALCYHGFATHDVADAATVVELDPALDGIPFPGEALGCAVNVVRRARAGGRVAIVGKGFMGRAVGQLLPHADLVGRGEGDGTYEVVIECAGTQSALDAASALVAPGGRLVLAGFHQDGPRTVDLQSWNWRGIDVVNAHEREQRVVVDGMRRAAELAASGALDVESLVSHVLPLPELEEAFTLAATRPPGFVKAVVCP